VPRTPAAPKAEAGKTRPRGPEVYSQAEQKYVGIPCTAETPKAESGKAAPCGRKSIQWRSKVRRRSLRASIARAFAGGGAGHARTSDGLSSEVDATSRSSLSTELRVDTYRASGSTASPSKASPSTRPTCKITIFTLAPRRWLVLL
jgi:hypothetical protein